MEERIETLVADTIAAIRQSGGKVVGDIDMRHIACRVNESLEALEALPASISFSRAKRLLNVSGNGKTGESYNLPAIATCPTGSKLSKLAGTVCEQCYARKGRFIFANVVASTIVTYAIVDAVLRNPRLRAAYIRLWQAYASKRTFVRLHGSGDVYCREYWQLLKDVAEACAETAFWIPTKERWVTEDATVPQNLIVRYSIAKVNAPTDETTVDDLVSVVVDSADYNYDVAGLYRCPATFDQTWDGTCADCLACIDRSKRVIVYRRH